MAQHDYNLANQSGADFRADLNNALSAIATVNSGATEPSTTFAHQLWVDTSSNVLKIRNAANNDWITTGVSITTSNTFTGNITGNADTATTLATARTINGVSFDGSANISFDTDSVSEGSSNLYFTNERVDDQVNTLLQAGTGIQLTYDDTAGTLTIANTNDADITGVVAGNGLTGGGTAGTVTLNVAVDDSSIEIDSDALRVKALGITNAMLAGSIANAKLFNSSVTINSNALSLGGTLTLDTDDIGEGSSNLYYTQARFDSAFTAKSTSDLSEGTNLYYTDARFDTRLSTKDTDDLSEGSTNLYYTDTRANAAIDARVTKAFVDALNIQAASVDANSVALGTDTTGNYIQTITGTANKITVTGSGSESADVTLTLPDDVQIADSLTVAGNLTVNGTLTSLDTTNLDIEDNLFQLNAGLTGSPVNDSGMLINRGSSDNGIFMWDESVDKFTLGLTTADGTSTGNITLSSLGTLVANLEGNVTGTIQTAAQPNITSLGTLTGLTVDDITINGSTISDSGSITIDTEGDFIVDSEGDVYLDAAGNDWNLNSAGTNVLKVTNTSGDISVKSMTSDKDLIFKGVDGGSTVTALTLDMSDAGTAIFNHDVKLGDNSKAIFGAGSDLQIYHDGSNSYIKENGTGALNIAGQGNINFTNSAGDETYAQFTANSSVKLYHDNSIKLATTSTGIDVTGTVVADGLTVESTLPTITLSETDDSTYSTIAQSFGYLQISADAGNTGSGDGIVFKVDNSEAARFDSSQNFLVGGTTTPDTNGISIETSASSGGLSIISPTTGRGDIFFGDTADLNIGQIRYAHSDNSMTFRTNAADRVVIDSAGNLDVTGTVTSDGIELEENTSIYTQDATLSYYGSTNAVYLNGAGNNGWLRLNASGANNDSVAINLFGTNSGNAITFKTATSEAMRIDSSQRVGIGTTSPRATLDLGSGSGDGSLSNTPSDYQLILEAAQSTTGDIGRNLGFANSTNNVSAAINSYDAGTGLTNGLVFATAASGTLTEAMRIDGAQRVGIGTTSPDAPLTVHSSSDPEIRLGYSSSQDHRIAWDSAKLFLDADPDNQNSNSILGFRVDGSERARIDDSGNLLIGKTVTTESTTGVQISSTAGVRATVNSNVCAIFNRKNADGDIALFRKDGTTVGSISNSGTNLIISGSGTNKSGLYFGDNALFPVKNGSLSNSTIGFGSPNYRFTDLYLSGTARTNQLRLEDSGSTTSGLFHEKDVTGSGTSTNLSVFAETGKEINFMTNGSVTKVMTIDTRGAIGFGTTPPSDTHTGWNQLFVGQKGSLFSENATGVSGNDGMFITDNLYMDTDTGSYANIETNESSAYRQEAGIHQWYSQGSGSAGAAVTLSEKMRLDSSGNLGIGVSSPSYILDVTGSSAQVAKFKRSNAGTTEVLIDTSGSGDAKLVFADNGTDSYAIGRDNSNGDLVIAASGELGTSNLINIESGGNVGIGASPSGAKLQVQADGISVKLDGTANTTRTIFFRNTSSSNPAQIHSDGSLKLRAEDSGTHMEFHTADTERVRIDSSGNILFGTTSTGTTHAYFDSSSNSRMVLSLGSSTTTTSVVAAYKNPNGTVGTVSTNGSATSYNTSSDARLKDVTGEARGLEVINELNPVAYNWKADGKADEGLIAQEVQEIVPNAVSQNEEEYYQMDYSKLVVHLVKGMKEQQEQIEELKQEIQNLKGE